MKKNTVSSIKTILATAIFILAAASGPALAQAPAAATSTRTAQPAAATAPTVPAIAPAAPAQAANQQQTAGAQRDVLDSIPTRETFDAAKGPTPQVQVGGFAYAARVILSLGLVVGLILITVFILKKFYAKSMRLELKGHHIRVLDVVQLGLGRAIFLVRVGDKVHMLGTADKGLTYLSDVTEDVDLEEVENIPPTADGLQAVGLNFQRRLNEALGINRKKPASGGTPDGPFTSRLKEKLGGLDEEDKEK